MPHKAKRRGWITTERDPWKLVALGMGVIFATALTTGVVVAHYVGSPQPEPQSIAANAPQAADGMQNAAGQTAPAAGVPGQQAAVQQPVAQQEPAAGERAPATTHRVAARPSTADIESCNRYARTSHDKAGDTITSALVGGLAGAGLGAAGGAIADGGSGAGKGAGIGGLVGVAAGTVYGLNEANKHDAQAAAAYRACMRRRGYAD